MKLLFVNESVIKSNYNWSVQFVSYSFYLFFLSGYNNIGECWREELEVPDLTAVLEELLDDITPFHKLLHAFVRHRLRQYYGPDLVSEDGPIPAHLLGKQPIILIMISQKILHSTICMNTFHFTFGPV